MKRHALAILAVVYALAAVTCCNAQSVTVPVETIDSTTHMAVQATVEFKGPESRSVQTGRDGRASVSLLPGKYQETITAPGYKTATFSSVIHPNASDNGPEGAMLEPVREPEELAAANAQTRPGYTVVWGYIVDENNRPVADAHVRAQGRSVEPTETATDYKGFYVMSVPSPPETPDPHGSPNDFNPGTATLTVQKSGYKTQVHTNVLLPDGQSSGLLVKMERGTGTVETDDAPAWMNGTSGNCIGEHACDDSRQNAESPKT